jgi:hypothetical protein
MKGLTDTMSDSRASLSLDLSRRATFGLTLLWLVGCTQLSAPATPGGDSVGVSATSGRGSGQLPTPPVATGAPQAGQDHLEQIPACPENIATPLFDTIPIDPAEFIAFRPLGFMTPPIHVFPAKHSSFSMTIPGEQPVPKPIRAPGPAWVVEIWEISVSTGGGNYQVFIYPCREVRLYFGHVASLSDKLVAALGESEASCSSTIERSATFTRCRHEQLLIPLDSGEAFGMGPDTASVDFGLIDFRRPPAGFIVPDHYDYFYLYYASPLDYFTPEAAEALESKTGSVFGDRLRTAEPIGGTYMQDLPGTAQGNWFFPGVYLRDAPDVSPLLALAHDYVDPAQPLFSIGTSIRGLNPGLYTFRVEPEGLVNRDFGAVTADGRTYCYENFLQDRPAGGMPVGQFDGILLLRMPSDTTLVVEAFEGRSCQESASLAFTADATSFER